MEQEVGAVIPETTTLLPEGDTILADDVAMERTCSGTNVLGITRHMRLLSGMYMCMYVCVCVCMYMCNYANVFMHRSRRYLLILYVCSQLVILIHAASSSKIFQNVILSIDLHHGLLDTIRLARCMASIE